MILDIGSHAAQRACVIVRAQRRVVIVSQNDSVLRDRQTRAYRQCSRKRHDDRGANPTAQLQQSPASAHPNHQHDGNGGADGETIVATGGAEQCADRHVRHHRNDGEHGETAVLRDGEYAGQQCEPQADRPYGQQTAVGGAGRRVDRQYVLERSEHGRPSLRQRTQGGYDVCDGGLVQQESGSDDELRQCHEQGLPP